MNEKPVALLNGIINDCPSADVALVTGTLQALYEADLSDVVEALAQRVIGVTPNTPAGDARDARLVDGQGCLREFPELLLRELQWVASVSAWMPGMRRGHALEAIELAGF